MLSIIWQNRFTLRVTQHHTDEIDQTLEQGVALMQAVILLGRQKRNDSKIKIKIPLKSLCIVHRDAAVLEAIKPLESYLRAELNVKAITYSTDEAHWICYDVKPCSPVLGKRFGKRFGHFRQLIANLTLAEIQLLEEQGAITLDGEVFNRDDILLYRNAREGMPVTCGAAIAIVLDTELDEALMQEVWLEKW